MRMPCLVATNVRHTINRLRKAYHTRLHEDAGGRLTSRGFLKCRHGKGVLSRADGSSLSRPETFSAHPHAVSECRDLSAPLAGKQPVTRH